MVEKEFRKMTTPDEIRSVIEKAIPQAMVYAQDPNNDGEHFQAIVISPAFEGMALIKQHQLVMRALKDAFAQSVHALSLKTFTPEKWNQVKNQYNL